MANSFVRYTGNGSTDAYAVPFSYRAQADVSVTIDGVATTAFTWDGAGTTITFTTAPLNLTNIEIRRTTSQAARLVDYADGSVLKENDLDTDSFQGFYMGQEAIDDANDRIILDSADFQWDAGSKRIKNVADPTAAQDAVSKYYLENTWLSTSDKANITTLAGISGLATLAGITSDVTAVAADATDIGAVAAKATEIGRLGTADAVADMALLGTVDCIADMAQLASTATIADLAMLAETDIVADLAQLATTDFVSDLNAIEAVKANVTTCADNLTGINNFADTYSVGATNPTGGSVSAGDIFFNTTDSTFKYYTGSSWASVTAGIGSLADDITPELGGDLDLNSNNIDFPTTTGISDCLDEDAMGSNSATALATQQSIKAYADTKLANVSEDSTPQLGGDLDVNGNDIVSASNGDINITPNGSGEVVIDGLIHPQADGNTGEFLKTDGAGNLDFAVVSGADITTEGNTFSNYNSINSTMATVLASGKNYALFGTVTVTSPYVWTVTGEPLVFI